MFNVKADIEKDIQTFIKNAETTEKLSDIQTYSQIKRLGNPLATRIRKEIVLTPDKSLKKRLQKTLDFLKKHKYID